MRRPPWMSATVCWPPKTTTDIRPSARMLLIRNSSTDCRPAGVKIPDCKICQKITSKTVAMQIDVTCLTDGPGQQRDAQQRGNKCNGCVDRKIARVEHFSKPVVECTQVGIVQHQRCQIIAV